MWIPNVNKQQLFLAIDFSQLNSPGLGEGEYNLKSSLNLDELSFEYWERALKGSKLGK